MVVYFERNLMRTMRGFLEEHNGSLKFTSENEICQVSFESHKERNTVLQGLSENPSSLLLIVDLKTMSIGKATKNQRVPGHQAAMIWIGTLLASHFKVTLALVNALLLCSTDERDLIEKEDHFRNSMEDGFERERKEWLIWYPSPKPVDVDDWLAFLSNGKGYSFDNLYDLLPNVEGFYRFTWIRNTKENRILFHDTAFDKNGVEVEVRETDEDLFMFMTAPLYIDAPRKASKRKNLFICGKGDTFPCFILPLTKLGLNGKIGPIRNPGGYLLENWLSQLQDSTLDPRGTKLEKTVLKTFKTFVGKETTTIISDHELIYKRCEKRKLEVPKRTRRPRKGTPSSSSRLQISKKVCKGRKGKKPTNSR